MKGRMRLAVLAALGLLGAIAVGAVYAITIEVPARGTFVSAHDKTELLRGIARLRGEPTDAAVQRIQLNVGEGPNWHTHDGPVTVLIKSGSFTVVDDLHGRTGLRRPGLRQRASRIQPWPGHDRGLGVLRHPQGRGSDPPDLRAELRDLGREQTNELWPAVRPTNRAAGHSCRRDSPFG